MSRPRSPDLDAEMRRNVDAILDLEARAGVGVEAARARDLFPYDTDSDVPLGSALAAAERRREEEEGHEAVVRRIRRVYFGVADRDLRYALSRGSRDMHDLRSGRPGPPSRRPASGCKTHPTPDLRRGRLSSATSCRRPGRTQT